MLFQIAGRFLRSQMATKGFVMKLLQNLLTKRGWYYQLEEVIMAIL
jgi:hypothetical protein